METDRLKQFLVVARSGSVRAAAEILHITPGGLSKSLDVLEIELGKGPLFRRNGRNLALTDLGRATEERAAKFLTALDQFLSDPKASAGPKLRISTFEVFSTYFLGDFLASQADPLSVTCAECIPGQIEQDVQQGRSDLGLTYEPIPMQGIEFLKICRMRMAVFGKKTCVANLDFGHWPFAAPRFSIEHSPSGVKGLDGWPDDKIPRKIFYEVDMMETALGLARRGQAVVHLPAFVVKLHNEVTAKPFQLDELSTDAPAVYRWVYLVQRTGESESKVSKRLAQFIRQLAQA